MSHDRGCGCGREKWEYRTCSNPKCWKKPLVEKWDKEKNEAEVKLQASDAYRLSEISKENRTKDLAKRGEFPNMRNLKEYPVTKTELLGYLHRLKDDCDAHLIGDMRPYLIGILEDLVDEGDDIYEVWNK